jgi:hypothetical protein
MNIPQVYRVVGVGWVIGRIAGREIHYCASDVFPSQQRANYVLQQRRKKAKKDGEA